MKPPPDAIEALLMQRLAAGDDLALNDLMDQWSPRLISFLLRMTGDFHVAHDLAQETFVRVYRHKADYRDTQPFHTWLFHIAANLARNHARWRSRHPESLMGQETLCELPHPMEGDTPAEAAMRQEQVQTVQDAVLKLPEDLREALVLSVYEEMSHGEIAEVLGLSAKAVEMRVYRARQMLRERLSRFLPPAGA